MPFRLEKKSLLNETVYRECLQRLEQLTADSRPQWGKMNAAQMFSHCAEVQEVMNGKPLEKTPFLFRLFRNVVKKYVVNDRPYQRNIATHTQYRQQGEKDFFQQKQRLKAALGTFNEMGSEKAASIPHSLFGKMTAEEKGWGSYKHINHHLNQFGV